MRRAHLPLALPIDEETVFVDFEQAIQLDLCVVLLLRPAIENGAGTERFRHLDLPIELESLRHLRDVPPTSGEISPDTAFPGFCQHRDRRRVKSSTGRILLPVASAASNVSNRACGICFVSMMGTFTSLAFVENRSAMR